VEKINKDIFGGKLTEKVERERKKESR